MLSVKSIKNVDQASVYFFEQDNYYLTDAKEMEHAAQWWGAGARALGLQGDVKPEQFQDLLRGKLPNGQQLGKREDGELKHRPGFDLTFSAPKSLSILIGIGKDERLAQAHLDANNEAMAMVEKNCAQARKTRAGKTSFELTGNLVVASFPHDCSREMDPQMHIHNAVMNATLRSDSQWRALASDTKGSSNRPTEGFFEKVMEGQRFYGSMYRSILAYKVQQLGYTIRSTSSDCRFEIAEVPPEAITHFSQRRNAMELIMEKLGIHGAKAASFAALVDRPKKQKVDRATLHQEWQDRAHTLGFNAQEIVETARSRTNNPSLATPEKTLGDKVALEAVHFAVEHLSERDTTLCHTKLLNIAAAHAIGTTTPAAIIDMINHLIVKGELIPLPSETMGRYTTKTLLAHEQSLLKYVSRQAYSVIPMVKAELVQAVLEKLPLEAEQRTALATLFTHPDRMVALTGPSGSGKTAMIPLMRDIAEQGGWKTIALTPSGAAAKRLSQQGLESASVSAFIQQTNCDIGYKAHTKKNSSLKNQCLIVDDASMLSARQIQGLQSISETIDARLIFLWDNKGYLSPEGGNPLAQMQKAGMRTAQLTELLRQPEGEHRQAIYDTLNGDLKAAFHKIADRMIAIESPEQRLQSMARHYASLSRQEKENTLFLLPTQAQCEALALQIRLRLKERGELDLNDVALTVLANKSNSVAETTSAHHYFPGDIVRFNQTHKKLSVRAGHYYNVVSTNVEANHVVLEVGPNKYVTWEPREVGGKRFGAVEMYTPKNIALSPGESLRWTRNHKALGLYNGEMLHIKSVNPTTIMAERKNGEAITLDLKDPTHRHFEYGYARTPTQAYHEAPDQIVAAQESMTALTTQRSFYKQLAQARDAIWLYTDEVASYLETVQRQSGDRLGAMDAVFRAAGAKIVFDPACPPQSRVETLITQLQTIIAGLDIQSLVNNKSVEKIASEAALYAMRHLAEREAAFSQQELMSTALSHSLGSLLPTHVADAVAALVEKGMLVEGHDRNTPVWTTREGIEREKAIIQLARAGKGTTMPIAPDALIDKVLVAHPTLTEGQKSAVRLITSTDDNLVLIQGHAGTGKTTMLQVAQEICEQKIGMLSVAQTLCKEQGYQLRGLAPTHTAVGELMARGIPAQTLDSFLVEIKRLQRQNAMPDLKRTVFVLDEASMVASRKFHELQQVNLEQGSKLIAIGDIHQLASIEAGKPFELLQNAGIKTAHMTDILRQKNPILREAINALYAKEFEDAFNLVSMHKDGVSRDITTEKSPLGIVEIADQAERLTKMAEDFLDRSPQRRESTLVITPANADRVTVNTVIRAGLREEGLLKGTEHRIHILVPRNFTQVELTRVTNYEKGDVIRFNRALPQIGIEKNSYLTVAELDSRQNLLTLHREQGLPIYWQPDRAPFAEGSFEVYEKQSREVAEGDCLRFTRTVKSEGIYAGMMGKVVGINEKGLLNVTLAKQSRLIEIRLPQEQHLDHAYAMTTHAGQGKTKLEVLYHQESTQKELATQRDALVALSRPEFTVTLYTDNQRDLLAQIEAHAGEKSSALEATGYFIRQDELTRTSPRGTLHRSRSIPPVSRNMNARSQATKRNIAQTSKLTPGKGRLFSDDDVSAIAQRLVDSTERVAIHLLGEPRSKIGMHYLYGSKSGSLKVATKGPKRGRWYDFHTGAGGGLLSLIAKQMGHDPKSDFPKTLAYAAELTGYVRGEITSKTKSKIAQKPADKNTNKEPGKWTEQQLKRMRYAQQLERESTPIQGTLAERYLREHRGITGDFPPSLRYHPGVYAAEVKTRLPALIVIAKGKAGKTQSVQTIYLDPVTANKAKVNPGKPLTGPIKGALVTLQEGTHKDSPTLIAEGVETGLSLKVADPHSAIKVTLGVSNFLSIPPDQIGQKVIFCLDNDGVNSMSQITAQKAMLRLQEAGKTVLYNEPNELKTDYNDVLKGVGADAVAAKISSSVPYQATQELSRHYAHQSAINSIKNDIALPQNGIKTSLQRNENPVKDSRISTGRHAKEPELER